MASKEVFLSYPHQDKNWAGKIKKEFEKRGYDAFLAHEDIAPSAEWRAEIDNHLESCSALIAVVTKNFPMSSWTNQEVGIVRGKGKPIFSLLFEGASLPGFLESLQAIPVSQTEIEKAVDVAVQAIETLRAGKSKSDISGMEKVIEKRQMKEEIIEVVKELGKGDPAPMEATLTELEKRKMDRIVSIELLKELRADGAIYFVLPDEPSAKQSPSLVNEITYTSLEDYEEKIQKGGDAVSDAETVTRISEKTESRPFDLFIAYDDATGFDLADHLRDALKKVNISSFVAKKDLPSYTKQAKKWSDRIDKVIETCNSFILILSTDKLTSEVRREVRLAFKRSNTDTRFSVIIFHLDGVARTSETLLSAGIDSKDYQQVDFADKYELARKARSLLDEHGFPKIGQKASYGAEGFSYVADQKHVRQRLHEEYEEQDDTILISLLICFVLWIGAPLAFFFWIVGTIQSAAIAFVVVAFITLIYARLRRWSAKDVVSWSKKLHRPLLFGSGALVVAGLVFGYTLSMYPMLSRLQFQTHLGESAYSSFLMFIAMFFGALSLYLPESSPKDLGKNAFSWVRSNKRTIRKVVAAYFIVALATASMVYIDTALLIATPKASPVESVYVSDGTVYVYEAYYPQIHAYVRNVETVHIQIPLLLLVNNVRYSLLSNSSETPVILSQRGVETSLIKDESGRLSCLEFSIDSIAKGEVVASVSYFSDLNASNVLRIESHQRTLNEFTNGTRKIEKEIKITNLTNYNLYLKQLDPDLMATSFSYATNTTAGSIEASYSRGPPFIYIYGQLPAHGTATVTITYNSM